MMSLSNRHLLLLSVPSFCKDRFIASEIGMMHQATSQKRRVCTCPLLPTTSFSLGTNQKLCSFCPMSNFTLRLKIENFEKFLHYLLSHKQKEMKASLQYKTKPFFGRSKTSTLFSGESYSYIVRGKVLGHKRCGT